MIVDSCYNATSTVILLNMKLFFSVVVPPFFHKKGHKEEKTNGDLISAYPLNC